MSQAPRCSSMPRVASSSVRSVSPVAHRSDEALSTCTIAGTARSIEYDGERRVWTAEADGRIVVRSLPRGEVVTEVEGREKSFCRVLRLVSPKCLWAGFEDGFMRSYNASTGAMEREFVQHDGAVNCIATSFASEHVYSGGNDWKVHQWSKSSCTYMRLFSGHVNAVRCVLLVVARKRSVWDEDDDDIDGTTVNRSLSPTAPAADSLDISSDEFVISSGDDGAIMVWDTRAPLQISQNVACVGMIRCNQGAVRAMGLNLSTNELWSGGEDGSVRIWEWRHDHRCISHYENAHGGAVTDITFMSPRIWTCATDGSIVVWDARERIQLNRFYPGCRNRPLLTMQRIYRSINWVVWLAGSDGIVYSMYAMGDETDVDAKLRFYKRRSARNKERVSRLQEEAWNQQEQLEKLAKRNKALDDQVKQLTTRLQEMLGEEITDTAELLRIKDSSQNEEIAALKATIIKLEVQNKTQKNAIAKSSFAVKQKEGIIETLTRQLCEKEEQERHQQERSVSQQSRQSHLSVYHLNSPSKHSRLKETTLTKEQRQKTESSNMKELAQKDDLLQEARDALAQTTAAFELYREDMKEQQKAMREERDLLRRQLLENQNYKELWSEKGKALTEAHELIEELQRSLEAEQLYVNELLQKLAQLPPGYSLSPSDERNVRAELTATASDPNDLQTSEGRQKQLSDTTAAELGQGNLTDLSDTHRNELTEILGKRDTPSREVAYPQATQCLTEVIFENPVRNNSLGMQRDFDDNSLTTTQAIYENIVNRSVTTSIDKVSNSATEKMLAGDSTTTDYFSMVVEDPNSALAHLRVMSAELERYREKEKVTEELRKQVRSRLTEYATTSPTESHQPIYSVTTEEYEAVLREKLQAQNDYDKCVNEIQSLTSQLEQYQKGEEGDQAGDGTQSPGISNNPKSSQERFFQLSGNQTDSRYTILEEENTLLKTELLKVQQEREEALNALERATLKLEGQKKEQPSAQYIQTVESTLENTRKQLKEKHLELEKYNSLIQQAEDHRKTMGISSTIHPLSHEECIYSVTAEEYEAIAREKQNLEREVGKSTAELQSALTELEELRSLQRRAEESRAAVTALGGPLGRGPQSRSSSLGARSSPGRNTSNDVVYSVTAEEYEAIAREKQNLEREVGKCTAELQSALTELDEFRGQQRRAEESRAAVIALGGPLGRGPQSRSSSLAARSSPGRHASSGVVYSVTAEEYEAAIRAKQDAEKAFDDALKNADVLANYASKDSENQLWCRGECELSVSKLRKVENERDNALAKVESMMKELEKYRRSVNIAEEYRASNIPLFKDSAPSQCRSRSAEVVYAVTAEEYESVARKMQRAEAERDKARKQQQQRRNSVLQESSKEARDRRLRRGRSESLRQENSWTRHRCSLGDGWLFLSTYFRHLVQDVFTVEVCRAVGVSLDQVRRVKFAHGGSIVDFEVQYYGDLPDVDSKLQHHSFLSLGSLLGLSPSPVTSEAYSFPENDVSTASQHLLNLNDQLQQQLSVAQKDLLQNFPQRRMHAPDSASFMQELEIFRARRVSALRKRKGQYSLSSYGLGAQREDPKAAVNVETLRMEPLFCVTLEEYRALQKQVSDLLCRNDDEDDDDDDGETQTRLWNEHVLSRAKDERQFTQQLSRITPRYQGREE